MSSEGGGGYDGEAGSGSSRRSDSVPVPEYNEHAVARDVFADLYFYGGNERARDHLASERAALGGTTVGELRRRCYQDGKHVEDVLYDTYGVLRTHEYFRSGDVKTLAQKEYVALNAFHELRAFQASKRRGRLLWLPAFEAMHDQRRDDMHCYISPDCYVLGPQGCGKTFFALQHLKGFLNGGEQNLNDARILPGVALYLQPAEIPGLVFTTDPQDGERDSARELVDWIREKVEGVLQRKLRARLPMHACIVLDNAGDRRLRGYFEQQWSSATHSIRGHAERDLFERVVLVMAGTGMVTDGIEDGRGGAYHFRTPPLQRRDLVEILRDRVRSHEDVRLILDALPAGDPAEAADTLATAVESQPALLGLARNARMAFELAEAVVAAIPRELPYRGGRRRLAAAEYWSARLGAGAPVLLRDAIHGYVGSPGLLSSLDPARQRGVALWTLRALCSMRWRPPVGHLRYPEFPGLDGREREAAMAMVEINTARYRNYDPNVRFEEYLATIVPANALVLFYLLGVPTSVLAGWATNDAGTVLYAILQWIVAKVNRHHDDILRPLQKSYCPDLDYDEATLKAIEARIAEKGAGAAAEYRAAVAKHEGALAASTAELPVELLPPWELHAVGGCIRLPRASRDSILAFAGGGGDLPDVVAPFLFLRSVRVTDNNVGSVDLEWELRKCSLLRSCEDGRLHRGFLALWGGVFDDDKPSDASDGPILISPEGQVVGNDGAGLRRRLLPELSAAASDSETVSFVLTTRSDAIRVALPAGHVLAVKRNMLDPDKQLDAERAKRWAEWDMERSPLGGAADAVGALAAWTSFLAESVLPQVRVKFLFVESGISPLDATSTRRECRRH